MSCFESLKYVRIKVAQPIFSLSLQVDVGALAAPHAEKEEEGRKNNGDGCHQYEKKRVMRKVTPMMKVP
jgi:hypothetical protein